jgi:gliding motility-associated-like protein
MKTPAHTSSLMLFLFLFLGSTLLLAQPAGIIVNEISQGSSGSREFAELVVVGPLCTTVDLRGWIVDDNNGVFVDCDGPNSGALSGTGIAPGHVRFAYDPIWEAVPVGTILLLYSWDPNSAASQAEIGNLQPDYDDADCDFLRVIPLNASNPYMEMDVELLPVGASTGECCPNGMTGNPAYSPVMYQPLNNQAFAGFGGRLGLRNDGDGFQTRTPEGDFFHGFSYGTAANSTCVPQPQLDGGPLGIHLPIAGANLAYQLTNSANNDYENVANYTTVPASLQQSPGLPNSCANAQWIASLRRPQELIFQQAEACDGLVAEPLTLCVGDALLLNLDAGACQSDVYSWILTAPDGSVSTISGPDELSQMLEALQEGEATLTFTASLFNSLLYQQGNCAGPEFPESLTYEIPVIVSPVASSSINQILSPGDFIVVNGTVYNQSNPSGVEVIEGGSYLGCDSTIAINLIFGVLNIQGTTFAPNCPEEASGSFLIEQLGDGTPPYNLSLNGQFLFSFSELPFELEGLAAGTYQLLITDAVGLETQISLSIPAAEPLQLDLGPDQVIQLGQSVQLNPSFNFSPGAVTWTPPLYLSCTDCLNPEIVQPLSSLTYSVQVVTDAGCLLMDEIAIEVRESEQTVYIPNIFSPNGDGVNDVFFIMANPSVALVRRFDVFDRWGELVFQASNVQPNDPQSGWDGTFYGRLMNPQVFVWVVEVVLVNGAEIQLRGDVALVR